ncbi:Undecaprenyl-diphosphatase [Thalassoglobus neptunius]|uniref:Undecaprenyl-diphosphatase n=1 Tax=Thalassoglobus neptunius TaxID=1938619 RepID=A0A5C5X880_9PLAN|nr:undecaprenyl-diphosphate phosphatase [Thalassoglobus neptunius]TWT58503.1 Undecaprenyl-diphosphatase [Thalassoglobus neptunius]
MELWEVIILGIVQGIAEFLPISSSGHLVILESLLGGELENLELNVALHFGTLMSILVVYRKDLIPLLFDIPMMSKIVIATLPVVFSGLVLKDLFTATSSSAFIAGIGLLITAGLLLITPRIDRGTKGLEEMTYRDSLVIGLFQAVAPMPGISRSGSTIVGGLLSGVNRDAAARFSFYIAIPALLGATVLTLKDILEEGTSGTPLSTMAVGCVVSFAVGIVSLNALLKIVSKGQIVWFGVYCAILGLIVIGCTSAGWL